LEKQLTPSPAPARASLEPSRGRRAATLLALGLALLAMLFAASSSAAAPAIDLNTLEGVEAEAMLEAGEITSVQLTKLYLERIEALNKAGPGLNAVTQINRFALAEAEKSDQERAMGMDLGPAMGLPILLKDIIDAKGMYTSAGDWALRNSFPEKDSGVAKELRAHGVILLGKAGLSEWANSFGSQPSGFSNLTGQVLSAIDTAEGPSGSSSGSGASAAASLAALTIGTETSGSIISPSTQQGDVGLRPTLGLVPGYGIAPILASQDTAGPIVRTVPDAAITLQSIAEVTGVDREEDEEYESLMGPNFLKNGDIQPAPFTELPDYMSAINLEFVKGKRIGYNGNTCTIVPPATSCTLSTNQEAVQKAKEVLAAAGAIMVPDESIAVASGLPALPAQYEEHATIDDYYQHLGSGAPVKSLAEEVAIDNANPQEGEKDGNKEHAKEALAEDTFGGANQRQYETNLPVRKAANHAAIEAMMNEPKFNKEPSVGGAPVIAVIGSVPGGPAAGDPEMVVPMGDTATQRRNIGVDINGGAYDEVNILGVGYVIEQGTKELRKPAAEVDPAAYRCAHTATPEPFAARGHCNPDSVSLMKMLGGKKTVLPFSLETTSATELEAKLEEGTLTSEELVKAELYRAALTNDNGPAVQALRAIAPGAITAAAESDKRRSRGRSKGALDGIPVVVDDSIDIKGLATSAGSIALQENMPTANATLVKNLEEEGAIILGDANVGEFDGAMEGTNMPKGYSSLGGQVLLPADTNKSPGGSSAGSTAAVAMGLAPLAVGIETSPEAAQMLLPAGNSGVVALKPTVGLVSTEGVLPVAKSQDSPGPIAQTVKDAAGELEMLLGESGVAAKYTAGLKTTALVGKNIAVVATKEPSARSVNEQVYVTAENQLNNVGASFAKVEVGKATTAPSVIPYEFHRDLNAYLAKEVKAPVEPMTLAKVIAYNEANKVEGLKFGQALLTKSQAIEPENTTEKAAFEENLTKGQTEDAAVIDNILTKGFSAILVPTETTVGNELVADADRAGYPVLTLPAGFGLKESSTGGDPIGIDLIGTRESEAALLAEGYALEQGLKARQTGPEYMRAFNPSVSGAPSETNQSMFRCVEGSAFYKPYDCNPGEVGFEALKIAGEGKLETPVITPPVTTPPVPPAETVTPPATEAPKSAPKPTVKLIGGAHMGADGKATIKVDVSGPGKAMVSGLGIKTVTIEVKKAGTVTLPITLKGAQKRSLATEGKAKVSVTVTFVASDGKKTTKVLKLTLVEKQG
jgi:Asp-tRNA(Asn)/Glu-tRNA(Gln) amidotransferase A subunit family amidase